MFFPIRTDRRLVHTPWVNRALILINLLVFILLMDRGANAGVVARYGVTPLDPHPWQFITYQFLHADVMHIAGNMLFLFVFGNSVEDRLGKVGYLGFYLTGGIIAGLGHALLETSPTIGASGSIAAVTGAYLALFPQSRVTIVYWFFFIGTWEVSSLMLILFFVAYDLFFFLGRAPGVAYMAHISGYAFGVLTGLVLLWTRLLPREPYDLLSMIAQRRRRAEFARLTRQGYQPWEGGTRNTGSFQSGGGSAWGTERPQTLSPEEKIIYESRSRVTDAMAEHDPQKAAEIYAELLHTQPTQVFSQKLQLDLSNQLMAMGKHQAAARAYELFLKTYPKDPQRHQVQLMLGLCYARYLNQPDQAVGLLNAALQRLDDPEQRQLANDVLEMLTKP